MSRKTSKRVSFSPDLHDNKPVIVIKHVVGIDGGGGGGNGGRIRTFSLPKEAKFSSSKLLWSLKSKMEKAITIVAMKRESSGKLSASSFRRSKSVSDSTDSHRAEAIEDCIEFLNSSSSLPRSNSVSGSFYQITH